MSHANEYFQLEKNKVRVILADLLPGAFIHSSADRIILDTNDMAAKMFGYEKASDLIGLPVRMFYQNPEDQDEMIHELIKQNGALDRYQLFLKRKNGDPFVGELSVRAIMKPNGELERMYGLIFDITQKYENESKIQDLLDINDAVLKSTNSSVTIYNFDGSVIYFNEATLRIATLMLMCFAQNLTLGPMSLGKPAHYIKMQSGVLKQVRLLRGRRIYSLH